MKEIYTSEYSEIFYDSVQDTVFIKWFRKNQCMSEMEFHEQLINLFDAIKIYNADIIFIDAYNFDFPILETSVNLIKDFISKCRVKKYILVKSQYLLGNRAIQCLLQKLRNTDIIIKIFDTRKEGELYVYS